MAYIHTDTASIALKLANRGQLPLFSQWAILLANTVVTWNDRYKSRHYLSTMSHTRLEDIGISPEQAELECCKPFWSA